jgi:hypothetical protein
VPRNTTLIAAFVPLRGEENIIPYIIIVSRQLTRGSKGTIKVDIRGVPRNTISTAAYVSTLWEMDIILAPQAVSRRLNRGGKETVEIDIRGVDNCSCMPRTKHYNRNTSMIDVL